MRTVDLFAGVGGIRLGFESVGSECVFASEIDRYARTTYEANFEGLLKGDISEINAEDIPSHDILLAGFPCQPFSITGKRQGFDDERGNMFFEIIRILEHHKPRVVFLENVKNLKTHDKGDTIEVMYSALRKLGYFITDKIMNATEYGDIPQNRERIYIIGFLDEEAFDNFEFPEKIPLTKSLQDCLEKFPVDEKYYYSHKEFYPALKEGVVNRNTAYQWRRSYLRENKGGVCPALTANMGTGGNNVPLILDDKDVRKLTPRECANLLGFPSSYNLPQIAQSNLYKQFGNSVCVPVIERIAKKICEVI